MVTFKSFMPWPSHSWVPSGSRILVSMPRRTAISGSIFFTARDTSIPNSLICAKVLKSEGWKEWIRPFLALT